MELILADILADSLRSNRPGCISLVCKILDVWNFGFDKEMDHVVWNRLCLLLLDWLSERFSGNDGSRNYIFRKHIYDWSCKKKKIFTYIKIVKRSYVVGDVMIVREGFYLKKNLRWNTSGILSWRHYERGRGGIWLKAIFYNKYFLFVKFIRWYLRDFFFFCELETI